MAPINISCDTSIHPHRRRNRVRLLLMLIVGLLISGCGPKRPPTATSAILKGAVISVDLPVTPTGREVIGVGEDKVACGLVSQYEPIFAVPPDRLPPALRELIELVPPAP